MNVGRFSAIVLVAAAILSPPHSAGADELADAITPLIEAHEGEVAVAIKDLKSGKTFEHRADEPMPTASLIKFPLMAAAYQAIEDEELDPDQLIALDSKDKVPGSGILTTHFSAGVRLPIRDAIRLMIAYSDNTATNLVIDAVGLKAVAELTEKLGCPETKLHSKVFRRDTSVYPERSKKFGLGSTTAAEMVKLFELLHEGRLVTKSASQEMLEHLYACEDKAKFPRYLQNAKIAHKTGSVNEVRCDAGLIDYPNGRIAICVLTNKNADQSWGEENAAEILCGRIARIAVRHFNPDDEDSTEKPSGKLAIGDAGPLVSALQRTLNARLNPSPELTVDGDFGSMTQEAVVRFQKENSLTADGEVNSDTWKALGQLVTEDPNAPDPETVNAEKLERKPADSLDGQPFVTSKAWAIADAETGDILWGHNEKTPLDIASTTKIMTCYLVLRHVNENPDVLDETIEFSRRADETIGSTADLHAGEKVSVRELLYGMMLPSGNDATVAFAEHFGDRIASGGDDENPSNQNGRPGRSYRKFVEAMNQAAKELGMGDSHFENTHGLTERGHKASAADLIKLTKACLDMELFREVVNTRQRGTTVEGPGGYRRNVLWKNTNRLLEIDGYAGVKTGTTNAAGACLVSHARRGDRSLIMAVLGASSSDARYADSRNLYRWAWNELAAQD